MCSVRLLYPHWETGSQFISCPQVEVSLSDIIHRKCIINMQFIIPEDLSCVGVLAYSSRSLAVAALRWFCLLFHSLQLALSPSPQVTGPKDCAQKRLMVPYVPTIDTIVFQGSTESPPQSHHFLNFSALSLSYYHFSYMIFIISPPTPTTHPTRHGSEHALVPPVLAQICRWHYPYGRTWRRTKEPLDESERGELKSWHPITSWQIDGEIVETVADFIFGGTPKSLQMMTAAMKLKDAYSLEEKLWPT